MMYKSLFYKSAVIALAATFCCAGPVCAETLSEALIAAYNTNPTLAAQRAALRAVDETVPQALSNWRPTIAATGTTERERTSGETSGADIGHSYQSPRSAAVTISQPLFRGLRTVKETLQAESNVKAAQANLQLVEQDVLLEAATAYLDVQRDKAVLDLRKNNEDVLKRQLEATRDRFRVGEITKTDVSQAEARYAGATAARINAEGALKATQATYERVIGHLPESLSKPDSLEQYLPTSLVDAVDAASASNPSVVAAEHTARAANYNVDVVRGELLPSVTLSGSASRSWDSLSRDDLRDNVSVSATLSVPLYSSGSVRARLRSAKHSAGQSRISVDAARNSAVETATRAWESLVAARAQLKSIDAQIKAASLALEGVEREAYVGSRTVLDVLDAEQELLDAKVSHVGASRDEVVGSFQLLAAMGRLRAEDIGLQVETYDYEGHAEKVRGKWLGTKAMYDEE